MSANDAETKQTYWLEMRLEDFQPKRTDLPELEIRRVCLACPEYIGTQH